MQQVNFNNCNLSLSRLIYGVWRLADDENKSRKHIQAKVEACIEQGITTFDHADIYGDYECEKLFGNTLKEKPNLRDAIQLITKCDIALISEKFPNRRVKYYDTSPEYITE